MFGSWKCWERGGVPELCIEILSESEGPLDRIEHKLERYHELGVRELVYFDPDGVPGERLRVWDRMSDDLVERVVEGDRTPCLTLDLHWVVAPMDGIEDALRLSRDPEGRALLPTQSERRVSAERAKTEAERAKTEAERAKTEAERRIAELEAELSKRSRTD